MELGLVGPWLDEGGMGRKPEGTWFGEGDVGVDPLRRWPGRSFANMVLCCSSTALPLCAHYFFYLLLLLLQGMMRPYAQPCPASFALVLPTQVVRVSQMLLLPWRKVVRMRSSTFTIQ